MTHRLAFRILPVIGLFALAGCSDEVTIVGPGAGGELGRGEYVISTTLFSPDGDATSLVTLVEDPAAPSSLDTSRSLEVGGAAALFGGDGRGVFALGSSDSPTITRYEVSETGELIEGARMSLAGLGFSSGFKRANLVPFLSASKAYWLDDITSQGVIWDPSTMTISGTFSLEGAERDDAVFELGEAVVRDGLVYVSGAYRNEDETEGGIAVALVIDGDTDEVVEVASDERCGQAVSIIEVGETLYFGTGTLGASFYAMQRPADYPAPCVLRMLPGEQVFDSDFYLGLNEVTDGRPAGGLVAGAGGDAYVLAFDESLLDEPITPASEIFSAYEAPAWSWWRFPLDASEAGEPIDTVPAASASSLVLNAGGREYITQLDRESGTTRLLLPSNDGTLSQGLEVSGYPYGLIRLR
jgi:hypothetical protein